MLQSKGSRGPERLSGLAGNTQREGVVRGGVNYNSDRPSFINPKPGVRNYKLSAFMLDLIINPTGRYNYPHFTHRASESKYFSGLSKSLGWTQRAYLGLGLLYH